MMPASTITVKSQPTPTNNESANKFVRASLLQKLNGYVQTQLVYLFAQLGVADLLVDGPKSSTKLATELKMSHDPLHRFLRGCVNSGLLLEVETGRFAATPLAQQLESSRSDSLRDYAILTGEVWYPAWGGLFGSLQTNEVPFENIFGTDYYRYFAQKPVLGAYFQEFMQVRTLQSVQALVNVYEFSNDATVVDIGGGNGTLLQQVLTMNPHRQGILYDLPEVVIEAQQRPDLQQFRERCQFVGGSFLQQVPQGGDYYILSQILHNWSDEDCQQILHNCSAVMSPTSRLLILEQVIPEQLQGNLPAIESDLMMWVFLGGQERTATAYEMLLNRAGFELSAVYPLKYLGYSLIEAKPGL